MHKSFKYRIYPTNQQIELLEKHFGSCRFVYNLALETKITAYQSVGKSLSAFELIKQITDLKKDCEWLKEVDSQALQQTILDLEKAYSGFFKNKMGFPKFKSKSSGHQSFRDPRGNKIKIQDGKIFQSKFRKGVKVRQDRPLEGVIKSSTISKTPTGKYFVSILCDTGVETPLKKEIKHSTSIGIDLGLSHFLITSEGANVDNPRFLKKLLDRIKVLQRRGSRKKKGSANSKKHQRKINILHEKVANQRKDFLHKLSTNLIKNHDTICLETLKVQEMMKTRNLALSISDVGWSMFVEMLKYKGEWYGKNILQIPTYEPSTKVCSVCGVINSKLTLADRSWTCTECNSEHDRDVNAAINIKNYYITPEGIGKEPVELPTVVGAWKQEKLNKQGIAQN
jgi:putative transposase